MYYVIGTAKLNLQFFSVKKQTNQKKQDFDSKKTVHIRKIFILRMSKQVPKTTHLFTFSDMFTKHFAKKIWLIFLWNYKLNKVHLCSTPNNRVSIQQLDKIPFIYCIYISFPIVSGFSDSTFWSAATASLSLFSFQFSHRGTVLFLPAHFSTILELPFHVFSSKSVTLQ